MDNPLSGVKNLLEFKNVSCLAFGDVPLSETKQNVCIKETKEKKEEAII